jgi:hypothetical protein
MQLCDSRKQEGKILLVMNMMGFDKLVVLKDLLTRTHRMLFERNVLPSEPVPAGKHLLEWLLEHIKSVEIPPEEIDNLEKTYWNIIQEDEDFLQIAQAFFADAVFVQRVQGVEPLLKELAENLSILINTMWGIVTYLPLTLRYLRTKDKSLETGVELFITALIVNIKALIDLDKIADKIREKASSIQLERSDLN